MKRKKAPEIAGSAEARSGKLKRREYERELRRLQVELCAVQDWVRQTGERIIVVFEGRDAAGKGGTPGHHRTREPTGVPGGRAASAI